MRSMTELTVGAHGRCTTRGHGQRGRSSAALTTELLGRHRGRPDDAMGTRAAALVAKLMVGDEEGLEWRDDSGCRLSRSGGSWC